MSNTGYADNRRQAYEEQVIMIARALRILAGRIEEYVVPEPQTPGRFTDVAGLILHDVTWGVANLNLDRLVGIAGEADRAEHQTWDKT